MPRHHRNRRNRKANAIREIILPNGKITVPPGSPKILIHTRQGKCVGIYCDHPAKVLVVETQDDADRTTDPGYRMFVSLISPQTSIKVIGGYGTAVSHVLGMQFDDPSVNGRFETGHRWSRYTSQ